MTDWAWIVLIFAALFGWALHFSFSAIVKSLGEDDYNRGAKHERLRIADWLDEMDRGLKKKQCDAGGDIMKIMGTVSVVGQISTLIRIGDYEEWTAWGKKSDG